MFRETCRIHMGAICSSETSVDFQRSRLCYIQDGRTLHNLRCVNRKSYIGWGCFRAGHWRNYLDSREMKWKKVGENYVMRTWRVILNLLNHWSSQWFYQKPVDPPQQTQSQLYPLIQSRACKYCADHIMEGIMKAKIETIIDNLFYYCDYIKTI
jgi:hypothetical protein